MTRYPWEKPDLPAPPTAALPADPSVGDIAATVRALQADVGFLVRHTAVVVHATGPKAKALEMCVNTPRGQLVPSDVVRYSGGHTVRLQDIGAPQVGAPIMTVQEFVAAVHRAAIAAGLELEL